MSTKTQLGARQRVCKGKALKLLVAFVSGGLFGIILLRADK